MTHYNDVCCRFGCDGEPGLEGPGSGAAVGAGERAGVRGRPGPGHAGRGDLRGDRGPSPPPLTRHTTTLQQDHTDGKTPIL